MYRTNFSLNDFQDTSEDFDHGMDNLLDQTDPTGNLSFIKEVIINASFVIGIIGNMAALIILHKSQRTRNAKHVLMLRCLAINDLVAQVGMLTILNLKKYQVLPVRAICVGFVFLRSFGLTSGCVASVMALERWMALTRPFFYQQYVTFQGIKSSIVYSWLITIAWTHLPLLGFGLYYQDGACARYRDAITTVDIVYAWIFFIIGTNLVVILALSNISVICELLRISSRGKSLIRRVSRSTITNRIDGCSYQTPEELAFARLMAILCIIFIVCWAPQMISVLMARLHSNEKLVQKFGKFADLLMCIYFTLDPYVYVIYRWAENGKLRKYFCCRSGASSNGQSPATTPTTLLMNPPNYKSAQIV